MNLSDLSPDTIWNFRQNHPELVVRDLREYLELDEKQCEIVRKVLLARGINKWLKVRRDLIAYKKQVKNWLKMVDRERLSLYRGSPRRKVLTEVLKVLMSVRSTLKSLCSTERWQIWPTNRPIESGMRSMNSLKAADM